VPPNLDHRNANLATTAAFATAGRRTDQRIGEIEHGDSQNKRPKSFASSLGRSPEIVKRGRGVKTLAV
jgi:hypothetical protein